MDYFLYHIPNTEEISISDQQIKKFDKIQQVMSVFSTPHITQIVSRREIDKNDQNISSLIRDARLEVIRGRCAILFAPDIMW